MKLPRMIMFDYGQTLVDEQGFDGEKGTRAVLGYAVENRYGYTARDVQEHADRLNRELGRFDRHKRPVLDIEVPNQMFTAYLYGSMGIRLSLSSDDIDRVFWRAAVNAKPADGVEELLRLLHRLGIRTAVITNNAYSQTVVEERINELLPENHFEFIISTSAYMFRKPERRIFDLALEKAQLTADEVWYIGDDYRCDIEGARSAGIFPVWYTGAAKQSAASEKSLLVIESWNDLTGIITNQYNDRREK